MVPHRYDVMRWVVIPATKEKQCSYVELVAPEGTTAQTPMWFVSHWYGRRVFSDSESVRSSSGNELETCLFCFEPARLLMTCAEATVVQVRGLDSPADLNF